MQLTPGSVRFGSNYAPASLARCLSSDTANEKKGGGGAEGEGRGVHGNGHACELCGSPWSGWFAVYLAQNVNKNHLDKRNEGNKNEIIHL